MNAMLQGHVQTFEITVEMRILDGHRGLVGNGGQQHHIVVREGVAYETLDGHDTDDVIARHHRYAEPRLSAGTAVLPRGESQSALVAIAGQEHRARAFRSRGSEVLPRPADASLPGARRCRVLNSNASWFCDVSSRAMLKYEVSMTLPHSMWIRFQQLVGRVVE